MLRKGSKIDEVILYFNIYVNQSSETVDEKKNNLLLKNELLG